MYKLLFIYRVTTQTKCFQKGTVTFFMDLSKTTTQNKTITKLLGDTELVENLVFVRKI